MTARSVFEYEVCWNASMTNDRFLPQQAAVIAFRRDGADVQVCLIRRLDSERWGIPKGLVDPGDTHEETALNEAWEEAGLVGRLIGGPIGAYQHSKWGRTCPVSVYLMEVLEQRDEWQEASVRERRWSSFAEAASRLSSHPVRPLLQHAIDHLTDGRRVGTSGTEKTPR